MEPFIPNSNKGIDNSAYKEQRPGDRKSWRKFWGNREIIRSECSCDKLALSIIHESYLIIPLKMEMEGVAPLRIVLETGNDVFEAEV